ncbi:esterase-like activity of phytase family protein [Gallaecimonas mangrovi]|uniref:esterase-like activity of phytase family protein n=1 Tax=Gallaecimonas mangrovi TaxID=2291597 RepID=UPI000E205B4F|nr:esterase-like activity of phytase family protein [Gallaecimonas mangrovi]
MRILAILGLLSLSLHAQTVSLTPLGQVTIPHMAMFEHAPIGGLSGLTYQASSNSFLAISDDRSFKAPARFYQFTVKLDHGRLVMVAPESQQTLTKDGKKYLPDHIDAEGIALNHQQLFISSEGDVAKGRPPFIGQYNLKGQWQHNLPLPAQFMPKGHFGVRNNLAFESLTITPDGHTLYTATESALMQDGPEASSLAGSPCRILTYNLKNQQPQAQYLYPLAKAPNGIYAMKGLSDMEALDNQGHLLAIERGFSVPGGADIALYLVDIQGATDIRHLQSIEDARTAIVPVKKTLIARFKDLGIPEDNAEGLALGPRLADGSRLLLVVSDDNFSSRQHTYFWAFALHLH